jgi:2-amino-4-hydroxy-6-hydroxymethyldihydropteridine diphosphokinase
VIKLGILENRVKIAYLGIGSNLGNRSKNIDLTKFMLQSHNVQILRSSSKYESESWPDRTMPKFINVIIKIKTDLSPVKLLAICNSIELSLGRKRSKKNDPRTCDIDIIDYDKKIIVIKNKPKLILPHVSMTKRNFVLLPLYEIDKSWKHPKTKVNITNLINSLKIDDLTSIKQL